MFETMELRDTVDMMLSDDYKERFKAEYYQAMIRWLKLREMIIKYSNDELDFSPASPAELLTDQLVQMGRYIIDLQLQAGFEGIDLPESPEFLFWQSYGDIGGV